MGRIKRPKHGREWHIQEDLRRFLRARDWHVERFIGNLLQFGVPDLLAAHRRWGQRWIDVKVPGQYEFTDAQRLKWPVWDSFGIGIWILTGANQNEYAKLFQPPNWKDYWKDSYGPIDIDALLDELNAEAEETQPMVVHRNRLRDGS